MGEDFLVDTGGGLPPGSSVLIREGLRAFFGGGGDALPEIPLGLQHPGVDQSRLQSDPVYREAARRALESHIQVFNVPWTAFNANGDGSPPWAVARDIEANRQLVLAELESGKQIAGIELRKDAPLADVAPVKQFSVPRPADYSNYSTIPQFVRQGASDTLSLIASPFGIGAAVLLALFFLFLRR